VTVVPETRIIIQNTT